MCFGHWFFDHDFLLHLSETEPLQLAHMGVEPPIPSSRSLSWYILHKMRYGADAFDNLGRPNKLRQEFVSFPLLYNFASHQSKFSSSLAVDVRLHFLLLETNSIVDITS